MYWNRSKNAENLKAAKVKEAQITEKRKVEKISTNQPDISYQEFLSFPEKLEILLPNRKNYKMYV